MSIDEAISVLQRINPESHERFSANEREAIQTLGAAGWSGDIQFDDSRLESLPNKIRDTVRDIIRVMQAKRVTQ